MSSVNREFSCSLCNLPSFIDLSCPIAPLSTSGMELRGRARLDIPGCSLTLGEAPILSEWMLAVGVW